MFLSLRKLTWVLVVALSGAPAAHAGSWIAGKNGCKLWNENPESNETAQWSGSCKAGYASGYGTAQWVQDGKPGSRYTGEMAKGKFHGAGVFEGRDGTRYEGDWEDGALARSVTAADRAKESAAKKEAAEAQEKTAALKKKNAKCKKPEFWVCTSADETMSVCCAEDQGCKNFGNSQVSCFGGDGISDHFPPSEQTKYKPTDAVYEENTEAIRRKAELDKQEADSLAKADATRIKQEKALALAVEEQNKKEAAQREEQAKQEQARQEAAEKQRIQDALAALQNLPGATQGNTAPAPSPTQAPSAALTQPTPAQQALDKDADEKTPCNWRCSLAMAKNAVMKPIKDAAAAVNSAKEAVQAALNSPVCSEQSDNYQECSVNVVAARGLFFGLGGPIGSLRGAPGSMEIINRQKEVGERE